MANRKLRDDCFFHDKDRIRHHECITLLRERLEAMAGTEEVRLDEALGRIAARPIRAPRNVPLHTNSAVDGYAFSHADYLEQDGRFEISQKIAAGDTKADRLEPGTAARIFTGAVMPKAAETVAMQEDCDVSDDGDFVTIPPGLKSGANCRLAGEDLAEGDAVIEPATLLRPQEIAAIASLGFGSVRVFKPLRVAVLSTGDELVEPGEKIAPGLVFDSNRAMLKSLLEGLPVKITDLGILADDAPAVEAAISSAAQKYDLILTSGGASLGDEDHIVNAIDKLGKRHLWQIAIKPGRPMSFGQVGDCVFMGLPGNPVAAFVCFLLYVRAAITIMAGGTYREPTRYPLPAGFEIKRKKPDRREFLRGWLEQKDGTPVVKKFQRDGSGLISGLRQATGLIELPEEATGVAKGEYVSFLPFSEFGINQ